jgi:hypothetical protein
MKTLNTKLLKVGDIILSTSSAKISRSVRLGTRSDISHAMIYVEDCSVIDATGEGVQSRNTQRLLFEDDCPLYALRLRAELSEIQARQICTFVRAQVGTQYSAKEAVQTVLGRRRRWTQKQFCSRLVAQAYASAGIAVVKDPNFCSPADLKESALLIEIQAATIPLTAEEAAQWEGRADIPQMMRDATNAVLDGARIKNKHIQNFDDLNRHLIEHPEDDEYVCGLFEESGYLTLWEVEKKKNPWQYDIERLNAFSARDTGIGEYCWSVLSNEETGPNRYIVNRGGYALLREQFRLRSFQLMTELYDVLTSLHQTRLAVATRWLQENGELDASESTSDSYLVPHTSEWFDALSAWDPPQAEKTKCVIAAAGRVDVCSICGDDPARDYRLEAGHRRPAGPDTLRLCDDCVEIRTKMGERFILLSDAELDSI